MCRKKKFYGTKSKYGTSENRWRKLKGGASQKWTGNEAELKPNPTKKKQQKEGNILRGPFSL